MPSDGRQATDYTAIKRGHGWFVVLPDETELGPYLKGMLALQVAVAHVLPARRDGLDAHLLVRDDRDVVHRCAMLSHWNSSDPCSACENASSRQPSLCPLRREMLSARAASGCPGENLPRT
jgi:hypothetical protein